jgi:hypothetical protein
MAAITFSLFKHQGLRQGLDSAFIVIIGFLVGNVQFMMDGSFLWLLITIGAYTLLFHIGHWICQRSNVAFTLTVFVKALDTAALSVLALLTASWQFGQPQLFGAAILLLGVCCLGRFCLFVDAGQGPKRPKA